MDLGLAGKTVIITGASGGIGRGLVQGYAAEGSNVVLASRDASKCKEVADSCAGLPGKTLVVATDVTDPASVSALADQTHDAFGAVDILVNNAGGVAYPRPFLEKPQEELEWELNLNIWGVVHCTRQFGGEMVERGQGNIVQITSNSALVGDAGVQVAHYGGTKGYVMAMTKALATEWGGTGVRINCVAPGWIVPHEQSHVGEGSFWKKYGYDFFGTPEQMAAAAESGDGSLFNAASQPIKRIGRPEDMAAMVMFFSSEVSCHLTGQLVSVSGGAFMF